VWQAKDGEPHNQEQEQEASGLKLERIFKMISRFTVALALGAMMTASLGIAEDNPKSEPAVSTPPAQFAPMTRSERFANYLTGLVRPESIFVEAAAAGISQAHDSPKEWGGGAEAYGERFGSVFAEHVIRGTLQYGASTLLHEDNRYFVSGQTGFFRRAKYAVVNTFLARRDDGSQRISFSRIGATAGASFISREWQPRSTTSAGDGAVNFAITLGTQAGLNVFREFWWGRKHHSSK
jgi:hypothetical protein